MRIRIRIPFPLKSVEWNKIIQKVSLVKIFKNMKKLIFLHHKIHWKDFGTHGASASGSVSQRYRSVDPDPHPYPYKKFHGSEHWFSVYSTTYCISMKNTCTVPIESERSKPNLSPFYPLGLCPRGGACAGPVWARTLWRQCRVHHQRLWRGLSLQPGLQRKPIPGT
jgi:hypothetical protein